MTDTIAKTEIRGWLNELLDQPEFQHVFPVELHVHGHNRVEVFVDGDEAVGFAMCRTISRHLEAHLDETAILGEKYTLEVSSPGTSRPLTLPRQFPKHVGRTLEVKVDDESTVSGELTEVTDTGLVLHEEAVERDERNKKKKVTRIHEVAFGEFRGATVQLKFR